jgi:hypothetical protein
VLYEDVAARRAGEAAFVSVAMTQCVVGTVCVDRAA